MGDGDEAARPMSRAALKDASGPHEKETGAGEHARHAEAVGNDEHEPEPCPPKGDRSEQHDERGGAWDETAGEAHRDEGFPADGTARIEGFV